MNNSTSDHIPPGGQEIPQNRDADPFAPLGVESTLSEEARALLAAIRAEGGRSRVRRLAHRLPRLSLTALDRAVRELVREGFAVSEGERDRALVALVNHARKAA